MTLAEGTKKGHICYQMSKINVAARLFATAKKIDNFVFSVIVIKIMIYFKAMLRNITYELK